MSKHKPTEEQQAVIDCNPGPGDVIAVKAFAGTGKTSCLVMFTEAHPGARILYLAYNKAMREEADKKFPPNVTCKTTHQICWHAFGARYNKIGKLGNMKKKEIADMMPLEVTKYSKWANINAIDQTVKNFMYSADDKIGKKHIPSWVGATRHKKDESKKPSLSDTDIVGYSELLWESQKSLYDPAAKMPHDGYLKLFQLSRPFLDYDIILFDEAQDANEATLSIIMDQADHAGIVCVGDPYQQMYAFRGSKNAFDMINPTETYSLTHSFRFGPTIAALATSILRKYFGESSEIVGMGPDTVLSCCDMSLEDLEDMEGIEGDETYRNDVFIARTNGQLLARAIRVMEEGRSFGFAGGFNNEAYWAIKAILDLSQGRFVTHNFISLFDSISELRDYAVDAEDVEMLYYLKLLNKYGTEVVRMLDEIKNKEVSFAKAEVKLTTAHKSKGLEFPGIWVAEDFVPASSQDKKDKTLSADEANILYVTVTRGIHNVSISKELTEFMEQEKII